MKLRLVFVFWLSGESLKTQCCDMLFIISVCYFLPKLIFYFLGILEEAELSLKCMEGMVFEACFISSCSKPSTWEQLYLWILVLATLLYFLNFMCSLGIKILVYKHIS